MSIRNAVNFAVSTKSSFPQSFANCLIFIHLWHLSYIQVQWYNEGKRISLKNSSKTKRHLCWNGTVHHIECTSSLLVLTVRWSTRFYAQCMQIWIWERAYLINLSKLPVIYFSLILRELISRGVLTLTWYTYMCLPLGCFFAKFGIAIGGFHQRQRSLNYINWVYIWANYCKKHPIRSKLGAILSKMVYWWVGK